MLQRGDRRRHKYIQSDKVQKQKKLNLNGLGIYKQVAKQTKSG